MAMAMLGQSVKQPGPPEPLSGLKGPGAAPGAYALYSSVSWWSSQVSCSEHMPAARDEGRRSQKNDTDTKGKRGTSTNVLCVACAAM
eukprot:2076216-Pyramimonas_sp.AAC.1